MNVPSASHMGGVWERMVRSARAVLNGLVEECRDARLDDELFRTLLCEVEAILNSRPLSSFNMSPDDHHPLSPANLLTQKSSVVLPPPGAFQRGDIYCRRRWRRVQYLADPFWRRWRSDFLPSLQERKKWTTELDNIRPDDIVLIVADDSPRCRWPLGRVLQAKPSGDGLVRTKDGTYEFSPRTEHTSDPYRSWCGFLLHRRIPSDLYELTSPDSQVSCRCDLKALGSVWLFELASQRNRAPKVSLNTGPMVITIVSLPFKSFWNNQKTNFSYIASLFINLKYRQLVQIL